MRNEIQLALKRGNQVQLAALSSNHHQSEMYKDDFYTLIMKHKDRNKGYRKAPSGNHIPIIYEFETPEEQDNFINYLTTDFARFCLCLTKNDANTDTGCIGYIPWLDLSIAWTDEKLFKHFNVSPELQQYIRDFLPDYYGIRNIR